MFITWSYRYEVTLGRPDMRITNIAGVLVLLNRISYRFLVTFQNSAHFSLDKSDERSLMTS